MLYKSTRNSKASFASSDVISRGISPEGGLFVPEVIPDISNDLEKMSKMDYPSLAKEIFSLFLTDFSEEEISMCVDNAYLPEKFGGDVPLKLVPLNKNKEDKYMLELWHGPTCAFKDMALQILPYFLTVSLKKSGSDKKALILVATSGDTGKAALEGFKDVENTRVLVFYPKQGVSLVQKKQMETQEGGNVRVCAVEGNFDDTQTAVKKIFTDANIIKAVNDNGMTFSSANSINWGRLLPQIVYYFYAYFELFRNRNIASLSQKVNFVVPTGNFGNILAAYYAKRMGLPVNKLICASNANNVLTEFICSGVYNSKRQFYTTASPSMDILVSSNLERLLYDLTGENEDLISRWMRELASAGKYDVGAEYLKKIKEIFYGAFCDDKATEKTVGDIFNEEGYLCDTHTAVAINVYRQYIKDTDDTGTPTVIASTANPYKFAHSVLHALAPESKGEDEFDNVRLLEEISGVPAPKQLKELKNMPVRFTDTAAPSEMKDVLLDCWED